MGILSTLTSSPYMLAAKIALGIALIGGAYLYGLHNGNLQSEVAIANFQKTKAAESNELNAIEIPTVYKIITQFTTKVVHIKDVGVNNDQVIQNFVSDHGPLSVGWVYAYNTSITGQSIDPTIAANGAASGLTAAQALSGINDNNSICLQYKEQIIGLQSYINGYNDAVKKANADIKKKK
jgi:hypothetical protein